MATEALSIEAANDLWARAEAAQAAKSGEAPAEQGESEEQSESASEEAEGSEAEERSEKTEAKAKPKAKKAEEPADEDEEAEEKPARKAKAKPKKSEAEEAEEDEKDSEAAEASEDEDEEETEVEAEAEEKPKAKPEKKVSDQEQLEKLAKKLGYRLDGAAVTPEERAGFRAEKRKWRERRDAEETDFNSRIAAANKRFNPLLQAERALAEGDYDAALVAMGVQGGLSEANEKVIERASGKDPRVSKLEQEIQRLERERQERETREQEAARQLEMQRADQEALTELSETLSDHSRFGPIAQNEWFLRTVLKVQKESYDGFEVLAPEDAALEAVQLLKKDNRAKLAYEAMRLVFEADGKRDRGAKKSTSVVAHRETSEEDDDSDVVDRSNETSARPGKSPTKNLPRRKAAEAGAQSRDLTESEWYQRTVARMAAARD